MVLVPILAKTGQLEEQEVFPASISIILPICITCLILAACATSLPWQNAWPYLAGSVAGGILAGILGKRIPVCWLHRALGLLIVWGGIRYLWG